MNEIKLDPKKLLGFKIIADGSAAKLSSPKIGDKSCSVYADGPGVPRHPGQDRRQDGPELALLTASSAMIEGFRFSPDSVHAARCDRAMHAGLADSLRQICAASDGKVEFDRDAIERLIGDIEAGPAPVAQRIRALLRAGSGPDGRQAR